MSSLLILLVKLIRIYEFLILVRIILSWIQISPYHPVVQLLGRITDPLLDAVRRSFPFLVGGGIDFSPILVFILLEMTQKMIIRIAFQMF